MKTKAMIVAAKTKINYAAFIEQGFVLIGVERGALDIIDRNLPLTLAIGDFDKVTDEELKKIAAKAQQFIHLGDQKDYFDGEAAVLEAIKMGCKQIYFVANSTKRYDKNISICDLIWKYDLTFINDETIMFLIKKGQTKIPFDRYQGMTYVSFLSNKPTVVTINNMVYNIKNLNLKPFDTNCMSNSFIPYLDPQVIADEDLLCIMSK